MNPRLWDAGSREVVGLVGDVGTSYFEYLYFRRTDYQAQSLICQILGSETLADFDDSIDEQDEVVIGPAADGFEPVTHHYLFEVSARFFQLRVLED